MTRDPNEAAPRDEPADARSEKLRALGQMAAGMSHDLRNLLSPLSLHLQLLERAIRSGATADMAGSVAAMKDILDRGIHTIERLRDFSRQSPERRTDAVDLNQIAREAVELCRAQMAAGRDAPSVIQQALGRPPELLAHAADLRAAVASLMQNAAEAMPDGGHITLRTGEERGGAWIEVEDDGPGMPPEVEERAFEPFFTTKAGKGAGLGLATVYACVARHGGAVTLETAPGRGARFRLWIPAGAAAPAQK